MSKEDGKLGLHFGALAEDVQKQVEDQGFTIAKQDAKQADELMRAVVYLRINGILTRSQVTAAETKILKRVVLYVREDLKKKKHETNGEGKNV